MVATVERAAPREMAATRARVTLGAVDCSGCGQRLLDGVASGLSVYCRRCRRWSERAPRRG